jgi:hypothetical protein
VIRGSRLVRNLIALIGLFALSGCSQTFNASTASGAHCQTTTHNYIFYAHSDSSCWDKNGNLITHVEGN